MDCILYSAKMGIKGLSKFIRRLNRDPHPIPDYSIMAIDANYILRNYNPDINDDKKEAKIDDREGVEEVDEEVVDEEYYG